MRISLKIYSPLKKIKQNHILFFETDEMVKNTIFLKQVYNFGTKKRHYNSIAEKATDKNI